MSGLRDYAPNAEAWFGVLQVGWDSPSPSNKSVHRFLATAQVLDSGKWVASCPSQEPGREFSTARSAVMDAISRKLAEEAE